MLKRACASLLLAAVMACGGGNSTTTSPSPTAATTTYSLTGQVAESATSAPITRAILSIADGPNAGKSTTTDSSGNYSFIGLQQSGFTVNVSASHYVSQSKGVTLTSNQSLSFQLMRETFTVSGTVTDGVSGGVLANVAVQITDGTNAGKSATTDGSGNYNIGGVLPDTFTMLAAAVSYQTTTKQVTVSANTRIDFVLQRSCTIPPGTPGFLGWTSAGLPSGSVQLNWGAASGIVRSYVIEVGTTPGGTEVAVIDTGSAATSYTLTGLTTSVDFYRVRVRAANACGVSGPSNEANPSIP